MNGGRSYSFLRATSMRKSKCGSALWKPGLKPIEEDLRSCRKGAASCIQMFKATFCITGKIVIGRNSAASVAPTIFGKRATVARLQDTEAAMTHMRMSCKR